MQETNSIMNLLRTILKQCVEDGIIAEHPAAKVKRLKEEPVILIHYQWKS